MRTLCISLLVMLLSVACNADDTGKSKSRKSESHNKTPPEDIYYMLATLDEDSGPPSASRVAKYRDALTRLGKKCPNQTHEQIGNVAYFMRKEMAKKGHHDTTLAYIDLMAKSIPDGETMGNCSEVAAALITVTEDK